MTATEIANLLRQESRNGNWLEKSLFYQTQRLCLELSLSRGGSAKVVLYCASNLAGAMAKELEDEAISATLEEQWCNSVSALEDLIRIADSDISQAQILWQLSSAIAIVMPPNALD